MLIQPSVEVFFKLMLTMATHNFEDRTNTEQDVIESLYFNSARFWNGKGGPELRVPNHIHYHGRLGLDPREWLKVRNMMNLTSFASQGSASCNRSFEDIPRTIREIVGLFS